MKKSIVFTLALFIGLAVPARTQDRGLGVQKTAPSRRIALVIGNAAYADSPLKNPVNDARAMAQALKEFGFDVVYRENSTQTDLKRAVREFGGKLRGGGVGLFYYAGHGVQLNGINYLIPVGAKVESEEEVEFEGVDAGFVLSQMEAAKNGLNIVILDACRNNPFARSFRSASRGLAQMDAPGGTLIAYATAPGSVASDGNMRNGIYTQELLKYIRTPGLGIEEVFKRVRISVRSITQGKQTPWEASSLVSDFYFVAADSKTETGRTKTTSPTRSEIAKQHTQKGEELFKDQRYTEAEAEYRMAVELEPSIPEYHYNLGRCLGLLDRWTEAETQLRDALQLKPDNPEYHYYLAVCLLRQKKYAEAETSVRAAIQLKPDKARYYAELASALWGQNKYTETEGAYQEAIRLATTRNDREMYESMLNLRRLDLRKMQLERQKSKKN